MSQFDERVEFVWTIENYLLHSYKKDHLYSSEIPAKIFRETEIRIRFHFAGYKSFKYPQGKARLLLNLQRPTSTEKVNASFVGELCNANEEILFSLEKIREVSGGDNILFYDIYDQITLVDLEKKIKDSGKDTLIIRLICMPKDGVTITNPLKRTFSATTEICFNLFSFYWGVRFSDVPKWSAVKKFTTNDEHEMQICINITCQQDDVLFEINEVKKFSLYSSQPRRIKCEIIVLSSDGTQLASSWDLLTLGGGFSTSRFPSFFKKTLFGETRNETRFMRLKFNFSFPNRIEIHRLIGETACVNSSASVSKNLSAIEDLTGDLRAMLWNEEHADVTFRIDGETVSAHKFILATRSPVFSAMFKQDVIENETGVVEITDMDLQTLRLFLEFLYTGEMETSNYEKMLDLLLAAEKYQVPSLKEKCSDFLKDCLTTDNVCDVVSVADMVLHQSLKTVANDFIKENADEVLNSPKWSVLLDKNTKLCSTIISNFSEDLKSLQKKT